MADPALLQVADTVAPVLPITLLLVLPMQDLVVQELRVQALHSRDLVALALLTVGLKEDRHLHILAWEDQGIR